MPPRVVRILKRLTLAGWGIALAAGLVDYCFVGGYRGFGPPVFALTGVLVGVAAAMILPLDRGWVENGERTGALTRSGGVFWLALGCWFSLFGVFMAVSPLKATSVTPRELIAQAVSPFFLCAGAAGLTLGTRALSRGRASDDGVHRAVHDIRGYLQALPRAVAAMLQGRAPRRGKSDRQRQDE